jgi:iron complex outermembrane receptor protein
MPRLRSALLPALVLSCLSRADAQTLPPERATTLDPIIVTAQMRSQAAIDVPISLTAWSGGFLEEHGITRYEDLAPFVPGFFASVQSPNFPGLNIRGISLDVSDPRAPARVSVFQDGISISRVSGSVVELFDLERVEVLKGPQTTLFGRSAEAGALSLLSNRPETTASAKLTAGVGSLDGSAASGYWNQPLGGGWLTRVAFATVRRDGAVDNLADGSDLNGRETVAVRPTLRWAAAGGATTVDLILNWQRDAPPGTSFKSGVIPTSQGDTDPYTAAELNRGAALGIDRTVESATAVLAHTFAPAWSLHALTGWRTFESHEEFDGDGSRLFILESGDRSTARQFSQEVRVNYDAHGRFTAFGGVTYARDRADQSVTVRTDERQVWPFLSGAFRDGLIANGVPAALAAFAVPVMNPLIPQARLPAGFAAFASVPPLAGLAALANAPLKAEHADVYFNSSEFDAVEMFLDGSWRATDRLELTAGVRFSVEDQTSGYQVNPSPSPSTLGFIFGSTPNFSAAPTAGLLTESDRADGWAGRLIARYTFTPDLGAYASLSRGRRPAALAITSTDSFRVSEESIVNAELGLKGRAFNRRLLYSAALFEYRYQHFHTLVQDPASPTRYIPVDAGRATGRGGELTLQGAVSSAVQLFATYGYTDATFDDTDENGQPQRYAGSTLRLTARHTAAFGATIAADAGRHGRFELTPVWQYRSGHYFDDDNTRLGGTLYQGGFSRVNLRLAWQSAARNWEVTARADNLLDKNFLIDAGNIGADFGLPTYVRGEPLLLAIDVTRRW